MPVISKITVQKKQKDRYNIFTDDGNGEKFAFSVDEDVLIKHQLKKGMELDEFTITEIFYQDDIRKAYNIALQYLAIRMRSEFEVRSHLQKKEIEDPIINEVIHKLYQYQFLNDQEFTFAYVRTQINTTDKGPTIIKQELKEKGIKETIIVDGLLQYSSEKQLEKAAGLAHKYVQKNQNDSARLVKQKLEQLLLRKGYPHEIIQETLHGMEISKDQDKEMEALRKQGQKLLSKYNRYSGFEFSRKMKQALYRKGFSIEQIDQFLNEIQNPE